MKNNKITFLLVFSLMTGILLTSCGTQATAEPAPTQAPPTQPQPAPTQTDAPMPTDEPTDAPTVEPSEVPTEVPTEAPAATTSVSFASDVMPIIQSRCINCHGGERIEEGLVMRSYNDLLAGSDNGPVIVPGDAANSLLVDLITKKEMPKKGPKLTPPQIQIITDWVAAGAPNN